MNITKRSLAPVSEAAWEEMDELAKNIISNELTARRFVDVEGPKGWDFGAVTLGRLDVPEGQKHGEVQYGIHKVLPLVESRIQFKMNIWELDNVERGAKDVDFAPLEEAAKKVAAFEESAVYYGFEKGCISGLKDASGQKKMTIPKDGDEALHSVSEAVRLLHESAIEGPYMLVINSKKWHEIISYSRGYPLERHMAEVLGGKILPSPHVKGLFVGSERGGDFKLTLGSDFTFGYNATVENDVELFFSETFTFQVLEPAAIVVME